MFGQDVCGLNSFLPGSLRRACAFVYVDNICSMNIC